MKNRSTAPSYAEGKANRAELEDWKWKDVGAVRVPSIHLISLALSLPRRLLYSNQYLDRESSATFASPFSSGNCNATALLSIDFLRYLLHLTA